MQSPHSSRSLRLVASGISRARLRRGAHDRRIGGIDRVSALSKDHSARTSGGPVRYPTESAV